MAKKIDYASLFTLRADGRYQGYYRGPDGKRRAVYDRDPARLHERLEALERPAPLTFRQIAEAWRSRTWGKIDAGTQVCYNPAYNRALDLFGDREAVSVEPFEIKAHLERMKDQDYSAQTIKVQRLVYRAIYRNAIVDEKMGREVRFNPATEVELPKKMKKPVRREAPEDEVVALVRRSWRDYWGLYPLFLMSTGMRRGEALAITWADVDFKGKEISVSKQVNYETGVPRITEPKTDAGIRKVPLLPDLKAALTMPEDAQPEDYIFHGDKDAKKPISISTYRRKWMHYCKEHGLVTDSPEIRTSKQGKRYMVHHYKPSLTAHHMRHGYATMLFEADVDVYAAQKLIGHADVETTMEVYTHLRRRKENANIDKLQEHVLSEMLSEIS